jgi:2-phospho-L-lactate transferase/gluconeogenesis factor (CofD/UPF0052 family)
VGLLQTAVAVETIKIPEEEVVPMSERELTTEKVWLRLDMRHFGTWKLPEWQQLRVPEVGAEGIPELKVTRMKLR